MDQKPNEEHVEESIKEELSEEIEDAAPAAAAALPDPIELIRESFTTYKATFSKMFPYLIVGYITSVIPVVPFIAQYTVLSSILSLLASLISILTFIILVRIVANKEHDPADIVGTFKRALTFFLSYFWITIIVVFAVAGASLFFIVPGIIIALYTFIAGYVYIIEGKKGMDALVGSWSYVYGRWWNVFWRMFVFIVLLLCLSLILIIGLAILGVDMESARGVVPVGITFLQQLSQAFIFLPLSIVYTWVLYKALKHTTTQTLSLETTKKARTWFKVLSIIGAILIPLFIILVIGLIIVAIGTNASPDATSQALDPLQRIIERL